MHSGGDGIRMESKNMMDRRCRYKEGGRVRTCASTRKGDRNRILYAQRAVATKATQARPVVETPQNATDFDETANQFFATTLQPPAQVQAPECRERNKILQAPTMKFMTNSLHFIGNCELRHR